MTIEDDKVMVNNNLKVLAINSLPSNGNAGLKMVMGILGNKVIPVPSLLLSGTGNMIGHLRFSVPFSQLLESSLSLAEEKNEKLILYIGYLGDSGQARIIVENISRFKNIINFVLVDPVCGDNGNAYVPADIIESWHELLPAADLATPNVTELALLSGVSPLSDFWEYEKNIHSFLKIYPHLSTILTGLVRELKIVNFLFHENIVTRSSHLHVDRYLSGAGDTFASLFIYYHFYHGLSTSDAFIEAGRTMEKLIVNAEKLNSDTFQTSALFWKWPKESNLKHKIDI